MSTTTVSTKVNISEIEVGDVFSEISHYLFEGKDKSGNKFKHLESGNTITLDDKYVTDLLSTADQYHQELKVTKEDKKDGTLGIRSIWENIHSSEVFTVCFKKQDNPLSAKKLKEIKEDQITVALANLDKAQKAKKGVLEAAKKELLAIQENPVLPFEEGEERILRGYKVEFTSRDGKYNCCDMDISTGNPLRQVNILTIKWLVFKGIKYTIE